MTWPRADAARLALVAATQRLQASIKDVAAEPAHISLIRPTALDVDVKVRPTSWG